MFFTTAGADYFMVIKWKWHLGTRFSGGLGSAVSRVGVIILKAFSNLNDSMILFKTYKIQSRLPLQTE